MLQASEFSTQSIVFHCFTSDVPFVTAAALSVIIGKFREAFDGEITTLPIPPNAAPEVPRIIVKAANDKSELQAGPERFSIIFRRLPNEPLGEVDVDEALKASLKIFSTTRKALKFRVSRIAVIATRALPIANPAMELAQHFCKPEFLERTADRKGALSRTENFELHAHKKFRSPKVNADVNSWVRCKTGMLRSVDGAQPAVVVEQDMNTPQEAMPTAKFEDQQIRQILTRLLVEQDSVLSVYFPGAPE